MVPLGVVTHITLFVFIDISSASLVLLDIVCLVDLLRWLDRCLWFGAARCCLELFARLLFCGGLADAFGLELSRWFGLPLFFELELRAVGLFYRLDY